MINYKCLGKVGPCLLVAESIGKDGETYYLNVNVKRRAYSRIKRTRKRQIMKAKLMSLPPYQRKRYKALNRIAKAIYSCGISINELSKPKKHHSVTNRKRWK